MKLRSTKTVAVGVAALAALTASATIISPANAADPTGTVAAFAPEAGATLKGEVIVWQNQLLATKAGPGGFTAFDLNGAAAASPINTGGVVKAYTTFGSLLTFIEGTNLKTANAGGTVTTLTGPALAASADSMLTVGPELWISKTGGIDRYVPTAATYPAPTAVAGPFTATGTLRMAIGPDSNVWVIDSNGGVDTLSRFTTAGVAVGTPLNFPSSSADPSSIALGADGTVWVVESGALARIAPTFAISEYPLPAGTTPKNIIAGPGGMWLTENGSNQVSLITVPGGVFTRTPFTAPPSSGLQGLAVGPDGNIWAVGTTANKIAKYGTTAPTTTTTTIAPTTTAAPSTTAAPTTVAPTTAAPTTAAPTTAAPTTAAPTTAAPPVTIVVTKTCIKSKRVRVRVGKKTVTKVTCLKYKLS